ncbi:hypothetical protein [Streptomyces spiramenti]|uniref:Uncharacterized protein n=1 Tax=Streptomyces spiramenti TaxID=2720606 RepID=A0ABX1ARQ8_9ACTN|nr:hypothetical protein [Streptomyces spiramenti]NJP68411.1 hypothetical protein [Streptomyces spiramenti]
MLPDVLSEVLAGAADVVTAAVAAGPLGGLVAPGDGSPPAVAVADPPTPSAADATAAAAGTAAPPTGPATALDAAHDREAGAGDTAGSASDSRAHGEAEDGQGAPHPAGDPVPLAAAGGSWRSVPGALPPIGRVPVDEQRTSGGREVEPGSGRLVEVLPLGAGLACLGLGLGMVGLRLRRD